MSAPEESHNSSSHQFGAAPDQDAQYQLRHEQTSYPTPSSPGFNFASINETAQLSYARQMPTNPSPSKRKRTSTGYQYGSLPSQPGGQPVSGFTLEPLASALSAPQGTPQQTYYQPDTQMSNNFETTHNFASKTHAYSPSMQQRISTLAPQASRSIQLRRQQQQTTTTPLPENRWQQALAYRHKVHEPPYIDPSADPTIAQVEATAEAWITSLTSALANLDSVKDSPTSHAYRTFLPGALSLLLLESTSRQIYTSLLDRCKNGFRGPAALNKALKPHKDAEADKTALCRERMEIVVEVLRANKRVCKDVLYEDWKVRLLVNAPRAYDREKDAQKGSNDQRRIRMLNERERLRQTEEELRVVRDGAALELGQNGGATPEGIADGEDKVPWGEEEEHI